MKKFAGLRLTLVFLLIFSMFAPLTVFAAPDGKKHFNQGIIYETSEQWDKAVEEFVMAVTENPKNPEYRLHYQRSLFNASQMFMKRGNSLAQEKDYAGAYLAYRRAYGYDPVNELAKSEMERMLRLQKAVQNGEDPTDTRSTPDADLTIVKTTYDNQRNPKNPPQVPQRLEKLRDVPFPGGIDLQYLIKELAKDLDLNVLFDAESFRQPQKVSIELKNVTAAKALDYVFLQQGLFFQQVGPHTILIANQTQRQKFQQLVLRTFYLANASPKDVAKVVQTAIPAQPGRTPTIVLTDDATNSLTVRDTSENIRLIGKLIDSLDKDRAEVVMDVQIFEVNKSDLLQIGNQIGDSNSLVSLGGTTSGVVTANGSSNTFRNVAGALIPQTLGVGFIVPAVNLIAFQKKQDTKLLASTQIHAFNNEDSSARIGQRVPVRSASFAPAFNSGTAGGGAAQGGSNGFVGDVINYEQVGLTLKFKPIVFPNQDVQVAMEIESKDVSGAQTLTPTFTERTIKGTARIQNNKTLLLASVAQNNQSDGRQGLPLLGLIPILGRLFTAPTKDNRQVDIVIAVTPRVIRAPAILPEDEVERETGSLAQPTNGSLEAMIIRDEQDELLAAARRIGNTVAVQLPDQKGETSALPVYVKSNGAATVAQNDSATVTTNAALPALNQTADNSGAARLNLQPIETKVKTLQIEQTADTFQPNETSAAATDNKPVNTVQNKPELNVQEIFDAAKIKTKSAESLVSSESNDVNLSANVQFIGSLPEMKAGEKMKIPVLMRSGAAFDSAILGLNYDAAKLAVRSVTYGDIFGASLANTNATMYMNQSGNSRLMMTAPKNLGGSTTGILAYIEVEALTDGKPEIAFDKGIVSFLTSNGRNFAVRY